MLSAVCACVCVNMESCVVALPWGQWCGLVSCRPQERVLLQGLGRGQGGQRHSEPGELLRGGGNGAGVERKGLLFRTLQKPEPSIPK